MTSNLSELARVFGFLSKNLDNIVKDKNTRNAFEEIVADISQTSTDQVLRQSLKCYGWCGRHFNNSFVVEDCWRVLANLCIQENCKSIGNEMWEDLTRLPTEVKVVSLSPMLALCLLQERLVDRDSPCSSLQGCMMEVKISGLHCNFDRNGRSLDDYYTMCNYLVQCLRIINSFDGDVVSFSGDTFLCVFADNDDYFNKIARFEGGPKGASSAHKYQSSVLPCCVRAIQCGLRLTSIVHDMCSLQVAATYCTINTTLLGGHEDDWLFFVTGLFSSSLAACLQSCGPAEVVVTRECLQVALKYITDNPRNYDCDNRSEISSVADITSSQGSFSAAARIVHQARSVNTVVITAMEFPVTMDLNHSRVSRLLSIYSREVLNIGKLFVPAPILAAVCTTSLDCKPELREVTTLCLSLDSYRPTLNEDPITLEPFMQLLQDTVYTSGGYLKQIAVDDKGFYAIVMWGVPSFAYANNCPRSLHCASHIVQQCQAMNQKCSVGIITQTAFCGVIGCVDRKEYVVLGNGMHICTDLMQMANGEILVDYHTYSHLPTTVQQQLGESGYFSDEFVVKNTNADGRSQACIYKASSPVTNLLTNFSDFSLIKNYMLRENLRVNLSAQLDKIATTQRKIEITAKVSSTRSLIGEKCSDDEERTKLIQNKEVWGRPPMFTVVIGDQGMGKSAAAEYFLQSAQRRNLTTIHVHCRSGEEMLPHCLLRKLFLEIVGPANFETPAQQQQVLQGLVDRMTPLTQWPDFEKLQSMCSLQSILEVDWNVDSPTHVEGSSNQAESQKKESQKKESQKKSEKFQGADGNGEPQEQPLGQLLQNQQKQQQLQQQLKASAAAAAQKKAAADPSRLAPNDKTFYQALIVLLRNERTVVVVEDAHFCDELSWLVLHQVILGDRLPLSVLITSRTKVTGVPIGDPEDGDRDEDEIRDEVNLNFARAVFSTQRVSYAKSSVCSSSKRSYMSSKVSVSDVGSENGIENGAGTVFGAYGHQFFHNTSFMAITQNENCHVTQMSPLTEIEVQEILQQELVDVPLTKKLVLSALDMTEGNPYWCKFVCHYIRNTGIRFYYSEIIKPGARHGSLKLLILAHFKTLTADEQYVLQHASIIGDEFDEETLDAILPVDLQAIMHRILIVLQNELFIQCVDEINNVFAFQNRFVRSTMYDLNHERDSASVHLEIARFTERRYYDELTSFFPMLSYHYRKSQGNRYMALKYTAKAANSAIMRGAYVEGFAFLQAALPLTVTRPELRGLKGLITAAIKDMNPSGFNIFMKKKSAVGPSQNVSAIADYSQLLEDINKTLKFMSKDQHGEANNMLDSEELFKVNESNKLTTDNVQMSSKLRRKVKSFRKKPGSGSGSPDGSGHGTGTGAAPAAETTSSSSGRSGRSLSFSSSCSMC